MAREKRNYVAQRRQVRAFHESVAQRRNPFPRLRVTPSCYAFVVRLRLTSLVVPVDKCPPASEVPARDTNQRPLRGPGLPPGPRRISGGLPRRKRGRMEVTLGDNDRLDYVLKKFRRQITRAGLFQDMKRKRFYESPSAQRRRKDKAAARRKVKSARRREHH